LKTILPSDETVSLLFLWILVIIWTRRIPEKNGGRLLPPRRPRPTIYTPDTKPLYFAHYICCSSFAKAMLQYSERSSHERSLHAVVLWPTDDLALWFAEGTGYPDRVPKFITLFQIQIKERSQVK